MRKRIFALLLALVLTAAGCGQRQPAATLEEPANEPAEDAVAVYDCGTVQIALPMEYLEQLIVETGGYFCQTEADMLAYPRTLMMVYEKASVEAAEADFGDAEGLGFLWGFCELDQAAYEQFLRADGSGFQLFAKSGDLYYVYIFPTDVQFHRSNMADLAPGSEDFKSWEALNTLGAELCQDIIQRNGLTPYSTAEIYDREFTYAGQHAYVKYYTYFNFDGSTREYDTLVLSQPAVQGQGGIWCVERMYDAHGNMYLWFPESDTTAAEHYKQLQGACDAGLREDVLMPIGAAQVFVSEFFGREAGAECFEVTARPDTAYMETNRNMSALVSSLLAGREVDGLELLDCMGSFTTDNWGVLGRYHYGSDWWPPLSAALEEAAVGEEQAARDRNMLNLYLVSYGEYALSILECLRTQQAADPAAFEEVLRTYSADEQALLRAVLE